MLMAAGMGLVAGLILASAQWRALRRYTQKAWWWLPANSLAWAAGMPLIFAAIDLAQTSGGVAQGVAIMAGALLLVGALVGAIHGLALVKLAGHGNAVASE
jgi:hypothetical protein